MFNHSNLLLKDMDRRVYLDTLPVCVDLHENFFSNSRCHFQMLANMRRTSSTYEIIFIWMKSSGSAAREGILGYLGERKRFKRSGQPALQYL